GVRVRVGTGTPTAGVEPGPADVSARPAVGEVVLQVEAGTVAAAILPRRAPEGIAPWRVAQRAARRRSRWAALGAEPTGGATGGLGGGIRRIDRLAEVETVAVLGPGFRG